MIKLIKFSPNPLQSDIATLKFVAQKDETMLQALNKSDVSNIVSVLQKSELVAKPVLVHGKHGTYWSTRKVNPDGKQTPAISVSQVPTDELSNFLIQKPKDSKIPPKSNDKDQPKSKPTMSFAEYLTKTKEDDFWWIIKDYTRHVGDAAFLKMVKDHGITTYQGNPIKDDYDAQRAFLDFVVHHPELYPQPTSKPQPKPKSKPKSKQKQKPVTSNASPSIPEKTTSPSSAKTKKTKSPLTKPSYISDEDWKSINDFQAEIDDNDTFLEMLKDQGVTWEKSSIPAENLHRAKVAYCIHSKQEEQQKQKARQKLIDLGSNLTDVPSDNPIIQKVLDNATSEQRNLYKSTGICAGDSQAESFVQTIFDTMLRHEVINNDAKVKSKISSVPSSSREYKKITKLIEDTWEKSELNQLQQAGGTYKIHGIYKIEGLSVEKNFQDIVKSHANYSTETYGGKNGQIDTFFHGTPFLGLGHILGISGQLKILDDARVGSMYGRGLYLASNSSKSAEYLNNHGGFLICDASLGNTLEVQGAPDYWDDDIEEGIKSEYNALFADKASGSYSLYQPEYVVYNENAVIPRYVVDMEITYAGGK